MVYGDDQGRYFPHAGEKEDAVSRNGREKTLKKMGRPHSNIVELGGAKVSRKQKLEVIKLGRDEAQKYLDIAAVVLVVIDVEGKVTLINKKGCEVLGYDEADILGKNWFDNFLPKRIKNKVRELSNKMLKGEIEVNEYFENPVLTKSGDERLIGWHGAVLRDEKGVIIGHLSSGEDITERKKAEETLCETTQTLEAVIQASPLPIFAVDKERIVRTWNPAAERTFGWSAQEVIGRQYPAIPKEKIDEADALFLRALQSGLTEVETLRQRKDGSLIDVSISAAPLRDSRGNINGVMAVITDITERKKAEQKLLENQAQLKSLASQLTLTEENERHRIATELHATISQSLIISKIKLDELRASAPSDDIAGTLDEVCESLSQAIRESRSLTFYLGSPILYELGFEAAVAEWLSEQIQKKHGIATYLEDDKQPKPLDDDVRVLLFRHVRELLTNVVKHAQAKKVKVSIRKVGSEIHISVEDNGLGFDIKEAAATAVREGGFGLFSIRERLEQLGGRLEIESAPGCGAKVTLIAPLKQEK